MLKNKLQITIITFNRESYLSRTLATFTEEKSPVRNFDILVLDNNSTDNTAAVVKEYAKKYPNISYIKNNYNVGANANIVKAFEYNTKEYLWVVADDDVYDWSYWSELERAIENHEKAIVISRMDLPDKNNIGKIFHQCAFVSACIFHKSLIDDTVMRNMYDNVYSMFPHLIPLVQYVNNEGSICVLDHQIIKHGIYENKQAQDIFKEDIFARGAVLQKLWRKSRTMQFPTGFAIALSNLKDEKLKQDAVRLQMKTQNWPQGIKSQRKVLEELILFYNNKEDLTQLLDIYLALDKDHARIMAKYIISKFSIREILSALAVKTNPAKYKIKYFIYKFMLPFTFGKLHEKVLQKYQKYNQRIHK